MDNMTWNLTICFVFGFCSAVFAQIASARTDKQDVNPCFPIEPTSYNKHTHTMLEGMSFTCCLCGEGRYLDKACTSDDKNSTVCTLCLFDPDDPNKQYYMDKSPHDLQQCYKSIKICTEGMDRIQGNRTYPAECRCKVGTFLDKGTDKCRNHSACKRGYGMVAPGNYANDTDCRWCPEGFESPDKSFTQKCTTIDYSLSTTTTATTQSPSTKTTATPPPHPKPPETTTTTTTTEKETVLSVVSTTKLIVQPTQSHQKGSSSWWVFIVVAVLILLAVVGYCCKKQRNRSGNTRTAVQANGGENIELIECNGNRVNLVDIQLPLVENGGPPANDSSQPNGVGPTVDTTDPSAPLLSPTSSVTPVAGNELPSGGTSIQQPGSQDSASTSSPLFGDQSPTSSVTPVAGNELPSGGTSIQQLGLQDSASSSSPLSGDQVHIESAVEQPEFVELPEETQTTGESNIMPLTTPSGKQSSTDDSGDDQRHASSDDSDDQESMPLLSLSGNPPTVPEATPSTSATQRSPKPAKKVVSAETDECNIDLRAEHSLLPAGDGFGEGPSCTPAPSQQTEGPGTSHSTPQFVPGVQLPETSQTTNSGPGIPGIDGANEPIAPNTVGPSNAEAESSEKRNVSNRLRSRESYDRIMLAVKDKISESITNKNDTMIFFRKFRKDPRSEAKWIEMLYKDRAPASEVFRMIFTDLLKLGSEVFNPQTIKAHFKDVRLNLYVEDIDHILEEAEAHAS